MWCKFKSRWEIPPEDLMIIQVKEYDTRLDSKNRFTVRGAQYDFYHVKEYEDGHIELQPRVLVDPLEISKNTLAAIESSVMNMQLGKASEPVDLSVFESD
jgi:hypothetical protein